jgi:glycosyltransferase involved in cell wall biosynthesis
MAAGKSVIVSQEAGASEIIQNGVNGIIVDNAKPEEIARRAELLMNDQKLREGMGEKAQAYVQKNLSWEKYAKTVESIFQKAIIETNKYK